MATILRIIEVFAALAASIYVIVNLFAMLKGKGQPPKGPWITGLMLCLVPSMSDAACTGASPNWSCAAATTLNADINTLMGGGSFQRNDTITITGSGTFAQTAALTVTKGVTITGPGRDEVELTRSGNLVTITPDATTISSEHNIKITGLTWNVSNTGSTIMQINGASATGTKPHRYVIIGNNRFKNSTTEAIHGSGQTRGVIYNNIFDRTNQTFRPWGNDDFREQQNGNYPPALGTADNLYFEDNSITCSTSVSGGDPGWIESGQGGRMVVRYNTWNLTNCTQQEWIDIHGQQNWSGGTGGQTGTMVVEFYGNDCGTACNGYRGINHRGGWGLYFNNTSTGSGALDHEVNQYDNDAGGSGCNEEMPNAGGGYDGEINNTYFWNLTHNGSNQLPPGRTLAGNFCGLSINNGWWSQDTVNCTASACTQGIGRGTTAPTGTCTTGTGYWVASTETTTINSSVIQAGHFYKCTSTNVWTDYFTPYTYPHPLRNESTGSSPVLILELASLMVSVAWHFRTTLLATGLGVLAVAVSSRRYIQHQAYRSAAFVAEKYLERVKR